MPQRYDVAIVGASIAGCTAATLLARAGARVALLERHDDAAAYKRACTHFIQSSGVPTLRRLGLMEELEAAGAVCGGIDIWTRWGWVRPPADSRWGACLNLRREKLDPLLRRLAAGTEGVTLLAGRTVDELLTRDGRIAGVRTTARDGGREELEAALTVGADGRDSRVAALAGLRRSTAAHGRFAYWAYYERVPLPDPRRARMWVLDPDVAYAFPTDAGLTLIGAFPVKARQAEFRDDLDGAFERFVRVLPDAPAIDAGRRVSKLLGRLEMQSVSHRVAGSGVALAGDAALASDPLWGVGCGWALQSAEWLADCAGPAIAGDLDAALARYRRRHRSALLAYETLIRDYARGRRLNPLERLVYSAAARDAGFAEHLEGFGTRNMPVRRFLSARALARAARIGARHAVAARRAEAAT